MQYQNVFLTFLQAVVPEVGSHPRPPTSMFPLGGVEVQPEVVQLQFVENLIKDAHEETRYVFAIVYGRVHCNHQSHTTLSSTAYS